MAECSTSTSSSGRNLRKNVSRPVRFEEEFGYSCFKKEKASEDDTGRKDKHYYDCSIVNIDTEKKKVLVRYTGFPQNCREWKKYDDDSFPVVKREPYFVPGEQSFEERKQMFLETLRREIKRKLLGQGSRRDDPECRIDLPVQSDVFLCLSEMGEEEIVCGRRKRKVNDNRELDVLLGEKWDTRIKNVNGDFYFVKQRSVKFWLFEREPIHDFHMIGDKFFDYFIEQEPLFILTFTRMCGNKDDYKEYLQTLPIIIDESVDPSVSNYLRGHNQVQL